MVPRTVPTHVIPFQRHAKHRHGDIPSTSLRLTFCLPFFNPHCLVLLHVLARKFMRLSLTLCQRQIRCWLGWLLLDATICVHSHPMSNSSGTLCQRQSRCRLGWLWLDV